MSTHDHSRRTSLYLVDAVGIVRADLSCTNCQYNLRGLSCRTACPECGMHVGRTVVTVRARERMRASGASYRAVRPVLLALGGLALANLVVLAIYHGTLAFILLWPLFMLIWLLVGSVGIARLAILLGQRPIDERMTIICMAVLIGTAVVLGCHLACVIV